MSEYRWPEQSKRGPRACPRCGVGKREVEVQVRAQRRKPEIRHLTSRSITLCDHCAREVFAEFDRRFFEIGGGQEDADG